MKIKTRKPKSWPGDTTIMLQLDGRTLSCIYPKSDRFGKYYTSDTFYKTYKTVKEAKEHMAGLVSTGYFD